MVVYSIYVSRLLTERENPGLGNFHRAFETQGAVAGECARSPPYVVDLEIIEFSAPLGLRRCNGEAAMCWRKALRVAFKFG